MLHYISELPVSARHQNFNKNFMEGRKENSFFGNYIFKKKLKYSRLTMLCQFQLYSKVIHLSILYIFFFIIGYYKILNIVCVIQQVLLVYLFYIQWCVYVNPKLLIYLPGTMLFKRFNSSSELFWILKFNLETDPFLPFSI